MRIEQNISYIDTLDSFVTNTKKLNIHLTIIIILIGLIGHFLTILVYSKKKFRINSSNIVLLCLAINDSLFLIVHFFEDTIRNIKNVYNLNTNTNLLINIIDNNSLACSSANYLRYSLRMISTYMIIALTIQRLRIVYSPLRNDLKSKKSAWYSILLIIIISFLSNFWIIFAFKLKTTNTNLIYCDLNRHWTDVYFYLNSIYIAFIMLIPIILIIVCNCFIIYKSIKNDYKRKKLKSGRVKLIQSNENIFDLISPPVLEETKSFRMTDMANSPKVDDQINHETYKLESQTSKITTTLLFVSFSYAFLNLPYLITW